MPAPLMSVAHLLLAMMFAQLSSGLLGLLIPVRAQLEGFSIPLIGLLGTGYYLGFVAGCVSVPAIVRSVGHVRAFAACAALAAATVLLHELAVGVWIWAALRVAFGFCFAGLYMIVESWLNERAGADERGRVIAAYMVVGWVAIIAGKFTFAWAGAELFTGFAIASVGICLAVLPVVITPATAPAPIQPTRLRIRDLYAVSPVGLFGCLFVGAANGAFWTMAPVYAAEIGLPTTYIAYFISAAVLGGALLQWPLGKWSDRTDRRRVIVLTGSVALGVALILVAEGAVPAAVSLGLAAVFGACALPLYALCLAHANDQAPPGAFMEVSSDLLMMFGIGAVFGPFAAAWLMAAAGAAGVFLFTAAMHLLLVAFVLWRMRSRAPVADADKTRFVVVAPGSTQAALALDPRSSAAGTDGAAHDATAEH